MFSKRRDAIDYLISVVNKNIEKEKLNLSKLEETRAGETIESNLESLYQIQHEEEMLSQQRETIKYKESLIALRNMLKRWFGSHSSLYSITCVNDVFSLFDIYFEDEIKKICTSTHPEVILEEADRHYRGDGKKWQNLNNQFQI